MSNNKERRKSSRFRHQRQQGGDLHKLHISVSSPRIVMFQAMRVFTSTLRIVLILSLVVVIAFFAYKGLKRLFFENEKYSLQEIELKTNGNITRERIVSYANIDLKANLISLDAGAIREKILNLPEVLDCKVGKRLPGKLKINLIERVPRAWLECSTIGLYGAHIKGVLVDDQGVAFPCVGAMWNMVKNLPIIILENVNAETLLDGKKIKHLEALRALNLLNLLNEAELQTGWVPKSISVNKKYALELLSRDGVRATFGMYDHKRQIEDYITIRHHSYSSNRAIVNMNLLPKKNIPVNFYEHSESVLENIPAHTRE